MDEIEAQRQLERRKEEQCERSSKKEVGTVHPVLSARLTAQPIADDNEISDLYNQVVARDPHQHEFIQAFTEIIGTLKPLLAAEPKYISVLHCMAEPERTITFRVPWIDDQGRQRMNRGFRVQYSSVLGPYKGGLRFHPSVNLSVIKFLGFEQIFKNALTGLPLGGAKGGADFDPKGKSHGEVLRFCQSFVTSLSRHIGPSVDVPSGDIGVGGREIGFLFGQHKRLTDRFDGTFTGKDVKWGGSHLRPEATGYGLVYFVCEVLNDRGYGLSGRSCVVSGSGNVAQYCCFKLLEMGAKVLTMSDSGGFIYEPEGFTIPQLKKLMDLKNLQRKRIAAYCDLSETAQYFPGEKPWGIRCSIALPCATQNEIDAPDAETLAANGCEVIAEGANMPITNKAWDILKHKKVIVCPGKAANAGGVAVSGLEMSQNSQGMSWTREEVDSKLRRIMRRIYEVCSSTAKRVVGDQSDLQVGANVAAFLKVADSMIEQGCT